MLGGFMSRRRQQYVSALMWIVAILAGCSKEKLGELYDKTKQKVSEGTQQVQQSVQSATGAAKEQLSLAGTAELQLDAAVATSGCYAYFVPGVSGRPNLLQLRSYRDPEHESFPSMMLQAQVAAAGLSELTGQVVAAQLFVQKDANSPVFYTAPGSHVELKLVSTDDKLLTAEIISGGLHNSHNDVPQSVTGKITAVWP